MEDMMEKVRALRKLMDVRMSGVELEVDGGVNLDTGKICVDAGANVLVAGSALFKAPDTAASLTDCISLYKCFKICLFLEYFWRFLKFPLFKDGILCYNQQISREGNTERSGFI